MTVSLSSLIAGLPVSRDESLDPVITGLALSSLKVTPGSLFVALKGTRTDGHHFVADAIKRGASAVLVSEPVAVPSSVACVQTRAMREVFAEVVSRFFAAPSSRMTLVGITGTNGKTTSTFLLEALLAHAGISCGVVGTVNYRFGSKVLKAPNTTPDLVSFQSLLSQMEEAGVQAVAAEVSSHALDQHRVDGLHFDAALFTNLTRDHLDYHPDFEAYFQAKARLFDEVLVRSCKKQTLAVMNADDPAGRRLLQLARAGRVWGFSASGQEGAAIRVISSRIDIDGISASVSTPVGPLSLRSRLLGAHNLENLLGVAGVGLGLGLRPAVVEEGLGACRAVPGRMEEVPSSGGFKVVVDYAHSDDSLSRVVGVLRGLTKGRLITIFGCGGDRDRGKRPLMGEAASRQSDLSIVTSDNPRSEPPLQIIEEVLPGVIPHASPWQNGEPLLLGERRFLVEPDRQAAIRLAIDVCEKGDVVLIAGKGHETTQQIGDVHSPFDDRLHARAALEARGVSA